MRLFFLVLVLAGPSTMCLAQNWEIGGGAGFGWPLQSSVSDGVSSAHAGYAPRPAFSVSATENPYNYIGGEFQYLFRLGGSQLRSNGITETASGYSNILVYNLIVYMTPRESKFRPFAGVGSGIRIYTNSGRVLPQPLSNVALLTKGTQVEPAISFDGGLKYMLPRHVQLRLDLRVYTTPTPNALIRPVGLAQIRGWIYDLIPMAEVGYIF